MKKIFKQKEILTKELDTFKHIKQALEHLRKPEYQQIDDTDLSSMLEKLTDNESENTVSLFTLCIYSSDLFVCMLLGCKISRHCL